MNIKNEREFADAIVKAISEKESNLTIIQSEEDIFSLIIQSPDNNNFKGRITLDQPYKVYLNMIRSGAEEKEAIESVSEKITIDTFKTNYNLDFDTIKNNIYPFIKPSLEEQFMNFLICDKLIEDLYLFYVVDFDRGMCFVTEQMLDNWSLTIPHLKDLAKKNFLRDKDIPLEKMTNGVHNFYVYNTKDGYDVTRVLLSHRFSQVQYKENSQLLIGMPNRDFLIFFPSKPKIFRDFAVNQVQKDYRDFEYSVSDKIYYYNKNKLCVYDK